MIEKTIFVKPIEAGGRLFLFVVLKKLTTVSQDYYEALTSKYLDIKYRIFVEKFSKGLKPTA